MSLEELFRRDIPLNEAAAFFVGVRSMTKQAEWTDAPDMTGVLEGQFNVPVEQVLDKLKSIIAMKWRKMVAWYTYAQCFRDHGWRAAKIEFFDHAGDEQEDATFYTKRAVALGGPVHMDEIEPPPPSNNPFGILKIMARAEQEAIAAQRELLKMVGEENPMRVGIDSALSHDQHHLDEMWQFMSQEEHQSLDVPPEMPMEAPVEEPLGPMGQEAAPPPEAMPQELEEAPLEVKAAALRMAKVAADKPKPTDEELKEVGRQRAVANMAAEAHRERSRRGERMGQALGSLGGAAAGAAAGRKYVGGAAGTIGGGALGYLAGGKVGKEIGTERDIKKNAAAGPQIRGAYAVSPAQQRELYSNMVSSSGNWGGVQPTFGSPMGMGTTRPSDVALLQSVGAFGKHGSIKQAAAAMRMSLLKMAQEPLSAGDAGSAMSSPTSAEYEAQNYLGAELIGRQAQEQNESAYYREQLGQAQQTAQMAQQQIADTQMQLQQLQLQAQEAGAQIQAATQQAVAAQDAATQQTLEAAKARIGAQEMRAKMLELASQDPQALGEQALAPPAPEPGMEQSLAQPGMEGQAAPAAGPPGAAPAPVQEAPPPGQEMQAKVGSIVPPQVAQWLPHIVGATAGAATGAMGSRSLGQQQPALAQKVQQLQDAQSGSFLQAARLAAAKQSLAGAELAQAHPVGSAIVGGLMGGVYGAYAGPRISDSAKKAKGNVKDFFGKV